jgi:hypothetical protein
MQEIFDSAVRWLRHPRLTLASNIQFVIGVGILAAGLVGGALKVLTDFPTVWLVLSAVGAFLTATGGAGMLARWKAPTATLPAVSPQDKSVDENADRQQERLRLAIGRLLAELEVARGAIEKSVSAVGTSHVPMLSTAAWDSGADLLSGAGLDEAHKATRIAYRHISELSHTSLGPWTQTEAPVRAIKDAERELEAAQTTLRMQAAL